MHEQRNLVALWMIHCNTRNIFVDACEHGSGDEIRAHACENPHPPARWSDDANRLSKPASRPGICVCEQLSIKVHTTAREFSHRVGPTASLLPTRYDDPICNNHERSAFVAQRASFKRSLISETFVASACDAVDKASEKRKLTPDKATLSLTRRQLFACFFAQYSTSLIFYVCPISIYLTA